MLFQSKLWFSLWPCGISNLLSNNNGNLCFLAILLTCSMVDFGKCFSPYPPHINHSNVFIFWKLWGQLWSGVGYVETVDLELRNYMLADMGCFDCSGYCCVLEAPLSSFFQISCTKLLWNKMTIIDLNIIRKCNALTLSCRLYSLI